MWGGGGETRERGILRVCDLKLNVETSSYLPDKNKRRNHANELASTE